MIYSSDFCCNNIPVDIKDLIFSYLDVKSLYAVAQVCKESNQLARRILQTIPEAVINEIKQIQKRKVELIKELRNIYCIKGDEKIESIISEKLRKRDIILNSINTIGRNEMLLNDSVYMSWYDLMMEKGVCPTGLAADIRWYFSKFADCNNWREFPDSRELDDLWSMVCIKIDRDLMLWFLYATLMREDRVKAILKEVWFEKKYIVKTFELLEELLGKDSEKAVKLKQQKNLYETLFIIRVVKWPEGPKMYWRCVDDKE